MLGQRICGGSETSCAWAEDRAAEGWCYWLAITFETVAGLSVSVSQDHLLNQVKSPRHGLMELVWNAFDADATQVDVVAEENSWEALSV
jgi:hypothetical protein